jgi:hypothetical protein
LKDLDFAYPSYVQDFLDGKDDPNEMKTPMQELA